MLVRVEDDVDVAPGALGNGLRRRQHLLLGLDPDLRPLVDQSYAEGDGPVLLAGLLRPAAGKREEAASTSTRKCGGLVLKNNAVRFLGLA